MTGHLSIDAPSSRPSDGVITLGPYELADATAVAEWDADREIQHWYDWPLTPAADDPETYGKRLASAEATVRGFRAAWEAGERFGFMIRAAGEVLGWVELAPRGSGRGNVSYGIVARHRGKGAAARAVRLASRYAFDVLGWERLEIVMIADNAGSRAVALKAGFRLEGVLRSYGAFERYQPERGRRFDWAIHALLRSDEPR
ncbi:MAG TPA: GNAT family N-acetyltransferase [Polyangia bacterium]|jgi:RimJ/RimL family protein N-acetyltransferase